VILVHLAALVLSDPREPRVILVLKVIKVPSVLLGLLASAV